MHYVVKTMVRCAVVGCSNTSKTKRDTRLSFFRIPKGERRNEWARAISMKALPSNTPSFVCSDHFSTDQINSTYPSGQRLRENAIPNILPSNSEYLETKSLLKEDELSNGKSVDNCGVFIKEEMADEIEIDPSYMNNCEVVIKEESTSDLESVSDSPSMEEKLIEAVRQYEELYNTNHINYSETSLKTKIWGKIAEELNLQNGIKAKHLWLKLIASYQDARRCQQKSVKSGFTQEFIQPWTFQYQMSFLEPFMEDTHANEDNLSDHDEREYDEWENGSQPREKRPRLAEEMIHNEEQGMTNGVEYSDRISRYLECEIHENIPNSFRNTTKNKQYDDLHDFLVESLQKRDARTQRMAVERRTLPENDSVKSDPLYNFFMSMYQITKSMPPAFQHKIRGDLYNAVSQAEVEIMNIASTSTSASQSPSRNPSVPNQ